MPDAKHLVLVTTAIIAALLVGLKVPYKAYLAATAPIYLALPMLFVLLAVPLWRDRRLLSAHLPVLAVAVGCGAITSVMVGIGFALGGKVPDLAFVLSVKSAPTAATLQFVELTGGPLGLTVVLFVATGIVGASLGQSTLRIFGVADERAQGRPWVLQQALWELRKRSGYHPRQVGLRPSG